MFLPTSLKAIDIEITRTDMVFLEDGLDILVKDPWDLGKLKTYIQENRGVPMDPAEYFTASVCKLMKGTLFYFFTYITFFRNSKGFRKLDYPCF